MLVRPYTGIDAPLRSRSRLAADGLVLLAVAVLFWLLVRLEPGVNAPFDAATAPS